MRNSMAFTVTSYIALAAGMFLYCVGIYNADWVLSVKGLYLLCMVLVIMGCIVVQKVSRDNVEDREIQQYNQKHRMRNTVAFTAMAYAELIIGFGMFFISIYNATFELHVKGYSISPVFSLSHTARLGFRK